MEKSSIDYPAEHGETEIESIGVYEGERNENNKRHGNGKALLPNGDVYIGQYRNGLRHGKGIYVFKKNGARYNGDWRHGHKYGQGILWYPDGTRYEGEWKHDMKHGFGVYRYANNDIYEGSWKEDYRHGIGTYLYANMETKFMGTWVKDRMHGPGQLVQARYRFYGSWEFNMPYGRGCFTFENACMQHGHYIHVKDPANNLSTVDAKNKIDAEENGKNDEKLAMIEESLSPKIGNGYIALWRARCITRYDPELLPAEAVPLEEEISSMTEESVEKSEEDICARIERYSEDYSEENQEEYSGYNQGEISPQLDDV